MSTPSGFISGFNYNRGRLTQPPFFGTGGKFYSDPSTDIPLDLKYRDGAVMLENVSASKNKVFLATGGCLVDNKSGIPGVFFSGGFLTFGDHTRFAPEVVPPGGGADSVVISTGGWDIHAVVTATNFNVQNATDYRFPTFIGGESSQGPGRDVQVGLHGNQAKIYVEDDNTHSITYPDNTGDIDLEDTIYVGAFSGPSGTSAAGNGQFGIRVNNGSYLTDKHPAAGDRHLIQNLGGASFFASIPRFTGIMSEAIIISGLLTDTERDEIKNNIKRNYGFMFPHDETKYGSNYESTLKHKQSIDKKFCKNSFLFSVRKLNPNYFGPAMRVRRQSDSQMADVFFDNNNIISSGSNIRLYPNYEPSTLTGFISGNKENLYVDTWYDQAIVERFTPVYGSTISFTASNDQWRGSNQQEFIIPNGLNSIGARMELNFTQNLSRTRKLLSYLEEVTTPSEGSGVSLDITGENPFYQANETVNLYRPRGKFSIDFHSGIYNKFEGSQVANFKTEVVAKDVYNVAVQLVNNKVSPFMQLGEGFVKKTFSPDDIPGLGFWVDAADTGTIITGANADFNNNHKVQGVIDKVSRLTGNVSTQTKVGYGGSGRNGLDLLNGSGVATTAITFPFFNTNRDEFEAFCVVREESTANETVGFFGDANFQNGGFMFNSSANNRRIKFFVNGGSSQNFVTGSEFENRFELLNGFMTTGRSFGLTVNGEETQTSTLSTSEHPMGTPSTFTIFDGPQGGHKNDFGGWFAEGLVYDRALTTEERNKVTKYLINKWHLSHATPSISAYEKYDVVKLPGAHNNVFDNYFYMTDYRAGSIDVNDVRGLQTYTGIGDQATRTFFFDPDQQVILNPGEGISDRILTFRRSFGQILNTERNQNRLKNLKLTFTSRTDKEAYAILHFLESHLGYKKFVYYLKDKLINKKKVFYCAEWDHTFNYKNSNTITATFVEVATPIVPSS
jgi:phage-related protein